MRTQSLLAALLAPALALSAMPTRAEMIGTQQLLAPSTESESQSTRIDAFLAREDVQRQLVVRGVDPADAASRVAGLTPTELETLSSRIDSLPAGGSLSALEIILLVLLIVLLI